MWLNSTFAMQLILLVKHSVKSVAKTSLVCHIIANFNCFDVEMVSNIIILKSFSIGSGCVL